MMARKRPPDLADRLPTVRGRYSFGVDLSRVTWFRVGGPAEVMFRPADLDDLMHFLTEKPDDLPVTVLGVGSNVLVRDGGIAGVVIRLRQGFRGFSVSWDGDRALVAVGAGALDVTVARAARDAGVAGLAFLSGVPGTIGGAVRMNAGAYGKELADVLVEASAIDPAGTVHQFARADLGFSYRHCAAADDLIFVSAVLEGVRGDPAEIARHMDEISQAREASQPIRTRTGGSTFTNPSGNKAWELIDAAGCRGLRRGGAQVSEKHCNFLVNTGDATAADIEGLGEEVRRRVQQRTGVTLEWEIQRVGDHLARATAVAGEEGGA